MRKRLNHFEHQTILKAKRTSSFDLGMAFFIKLNQFNIHILPKTTVRIKNLAIWKYALSEQYIQRLFTFGLDYVAIDFYRLNEYRQQVNTLTFTNDQEYFENRLLIPFNEPFDEILWENKKTKIEYDRLNYFLVNNEIIQLFGHKSYLVLDKSIDSWYQYTFVFDICLHHLPLQLITLNSQSNIYVNDNCQLSLSLNNNQRTIQGNSKLKLHEYIHLLISVQNQSIKIFLNGLLELNENIDNEHLIINDKRIDLFKDLNSTMNITDENILRIECKSITYLNKAIIDIENQIKSLNSSLERLTAYPYSIISPSLLRIGYDEFSRIC